MSIQFNQVSYIYQQGTPYEFEAIKNVSLTLEQGKYYAIIGQTGSGKSTLIQHLNALLKPTTGSVNINGLEVTNKTKDKHLRHIRNVMSSSPFQMSGGQMRKIAIVSILAMDPQVIILDEPTAGLDPNSKHQVMSLIKKIQIEENKTIILVSHDMDDVARYSDEVVVMNKGTIVEKSNPRNLFNQKTQLLKWHIELPKVVKLQKDIEKKYNMLFPKLATNEEEFVKLYKEWHHEE
ncbi:MAG: ATP-binding cassette domain-containing protein [Staphylococcus epidermidis]|nr:ATP-binding cassette domain-containing protein [Staphylococcus epidermidis]